MARSRTTPDCFMAERRFEIWHIGLVPGLQKVWNAGNGVPGQITFHRTKCLMTCPIIMIYYILDTLSNIVFLYFTNCSIIMTSSTIKLNKFTKNAKYMHVCHSLPKLQHMNTIGQFWVSNFFSRALPVGGELFHKEPCELRFFLNLAFKVVKLFKISIPVLKVGTS